MSPARPLVTAALLASAASFATSQRYTITDLGTLGGNYSRAYDISDTGYIVGETNLANGLIVPFRWHLGGMSQISPVGTGGFARAVNNAGDTVGMENGQWVRFGTPSTVIVAGVGGLHDINDSGWITGWRNGSGHQPFVWRPGSGMVDLPQYLSPPVYGDPYAINNSGLMVGASAQGSMHVGVKWPSDSQIVRVPGYGSDIWWRGDILAVTDNGLMAGGAHNDTSSITHAAVIVGNGLQDIDPTEPNFSIALDINSFGVTVGAKGGPGGGNERAFVYDGTLRTDLIAANSGWILEEATGINDAGWITGYGIHNGNARAFLLTPRQTITGKVTLENYFGAASPEGVEITFEIRQPGSTTAIDTQVAPLDVNGNYNFAAANVPPGTYDVTAKGPHWLRKKVANVTIGTFGTTSALNYTLWNGDVNGDNVISLADFAALRFAYGSMPGDSNWNPNADMSGDGVVSLFDFAILRTHFGVSGDE